VTSFQNPIAYRKVNYYMKSAVVFECTYILLCEPYYLFRVFQSYKGKNLLSPILPHLLSGLCDDSRVMMVGASIALISSKRVCVCMRF
jgi:hypothetical protein